MTSPGLSRDHYDSELSQHHAKLICDAREINLDDGEETDLLRENNPGLYAAYEAIIAIAIGE